MQVIAKDLIKLFNGNKRWKATDLTVEEASVVAIAIASLQMQGAGQVEKFVADIGDIIRANLTDASNHDLVNLAKSTFYMRRFEHTKDLYSHVHAECVTRFNLRKLEAEDKERLSRVFSEHGIMLESPFNKGGVRVTR